MKNGNTVSAQNMTMARELCPVERQGDFEAWFNEWLTASLEFLEQTRMMKAEFEREHAA